MIQLTVEMDHSKGAALNHQPPQIFHSREVLGTFAGTKVPGIMTEQWNLIYYALDNIQLRFHNRGCTFFMFGIKILL
jgi:hypothetical protein